ncbi:hypothetical protein GFS60_08013 (plasmid) [Rhodococcus sp. WAY2]|nr:hypothetical protein GFS60_08013 [Rhodococcus sp. WAY2]
MREQHLTLPLHVGSWMRLTVRHDVVAAPAPELWKRQWHTRRR